MNRNDFSPTADTASGVLGKEFAVLDCTLTKEEIYNRFFVSETIGVATAALKMFKSV